MGYKGIREIKDLFDEIDEDYYKPIKTNNSAFNDNYCEYDSKENKYNSLSPKEYLDMIRPYLHDMINDHKAPMNFRVNLPDKVIYYEI